jgi:hypothetical protein
MGLKGAKNDPILVLNAKGGEIKGQSKWISYHLWILKKIRVRTFDLSKILLLQNLVSCGENFDYGKRGSFWHLINFSLGISLYMPKQVCLT